MIESVQNQSTNINDNTMKNYETLKVQTMQHSLGSGFQSIQCQFIFRKLILARFHLFLSRTTISGHLFWYRLQIRLSYDLVVILFLANVRILHLPPNSSSDDCSLRLQRIVNVPMMTFSQKVGNLILNNTTIARIPHDLVQSN